VVSTQGLAAARIPDQVVGHLQLPVVEPIQDLAAAPLPRQAVDCIPAQAVGLTLVRAAVPIPAQAVGHIQDQVAGVIPDLVGWQPISGTAHHPIANRSLACAPQWHAVLLIL
jgi:hypothetical protein